MQTPWFDIVSALLILVIGAKGLFNGVVRELSGLLGLVAGIWAGSLYAGGFGRWLGRHLIPLDSPSALSMIGFLTLLFLVWTFFVVLGVAVEKRLALSEPGIADRIGGFFVASLKVFIILAVLVNALSSLEFVRKNMDRFVERSLFYPWYIRTGEVLLPVRGRGTAEQRKRLEKEAGNFIGIGGKAPGETNATRKAR